MKNLSMAALIALIFSAGITTTSKAQTTLVNIENFAAPVAEKTMPSITPYYNSDGKLIYIVKRYQASSLPERETNIVKNNFYNYNINGVEEVSAPASRIYFVHISNNKKLLTVKIENGATDIIKEYRNGSAVN